MIIPNESLIIQGLTLGSLKNFKVIYFFDINGVHDNSNSHNSNYNSSELLINK